MASEMKPQGVANTVWASAELVRTGLTVDAKTHQAVIDTFSSIEDKIQSIRITRRGRRILIIRIQHRSVL